MKVYANLLGDWVELNGHGEIFNTPVQQWVKENNLHEHVFVSIKYKGKGYKIHVSQIQLVQN
jgi:hypothetical protein